MSSIYPPPPLATPADMELPVFETTAVFEDGKVVTERIPGTVGDTEWLWNDGNYGCDCNRRIFRGEPEEDEDGNPLPCGDTIKLAALVVTLQDGRQIALRTESI